MILWLSINNYNSVWFYFYLYTFFQFGNNCFSFSLSGNLLCIFLLVISVFFGVGWLITRAYAHTYI